MIPGFFFIFGLLILWWAGSGYLATLLLMTGSGLKKDPAPEEGEVVPEVYLVVPTYNEEQIIPLKMENIRATLYPPDRLHVVFVDGGSTDRTRAIISAALAENSTWALLESPAAGKINQLNYVLDFLEDRDPSVVVINSDVDAMLEPEAISGLARCLAASPATGVAGAMISPADQAAALERQHWLQQNQLRSLEGALYSAGSLVAPCYAFRRDLLVRFPQDCVADDLYLVYHANAKGMRVKFLESSRGSEIRVPTSLGEFMRHKFRKSNACLREGLRFVPAYLRFAPPWRVIFTAKLLQILVCPFLIPILAGLTFLLVSGGLFQALLAAGGWGLFLAGVVMTPRMIAGPVPAAASGRGAGVLMLFSLGLTTLVLVATVISYPFYRQDSCYAKVAR